MRRRAPFVIATALLAGMLLTLWGVSPWGPHAGYSGSVSCRQCHEKFYTLWSTSFHGLAMQPYSSGLAAQLTSKSEPLTVGNARYRASITPQGGTMTEEGPSGIQRHPITYALGGKNVFYFLTPREKGRLQTLPLAYDVRRKEWYDTAASAVRHFPDVQDERIDWRDPAYTFNTSCHSCHVSQMTNNYHAESDRYRTTWAEPGINCETCHGPSAKHVQVCTRAPPGRPPEDLKIIATKRLTPEQRNDLCSGCHAKMSPITPAFAPGERYVDHFDLVGLENADFYPDGRDLGENFTLTTWRMSPCLKGRIECMHCHTSSGRYKFREGPAVDPNGSCRPCHDEKARDIAAHARHKPGTPGGRCVDCHMPMTEFARMRRSDHSMRPPTPAATIAFKSPNACTICHADQGAAWADRLVREWHPKDYQSTVVKRAGLIDAARRRDWGRLVEMLDAVRDPSRDEVFAASLIRLLASCDDARKWPVLIGALRDPAPLVRSSAASGLTGRLTAETVPALLGALQDDVRLVRIRAASALAALPQARVPPSDRAALDRANAELEAAFRARPDDWSSHYNLGNMYLDRGDARRAAEEFGTATRLRPDTVIPWVNLAIAQARLGEPPKAEASLRRALAIDPKNAAAWFNLGLLLAEGGKRAEGESALRAALDADPRHAQAAYNLGLLAIDRDPRAGLELLARAWSLRPDESRYGYSLGFHQARQRDAAGAIATLSDVATRHPAYGDAVLLLVEVLAREGRAAEAAAACRRAIGTADLAPQDRARIEGILRALSTSR
jgi:tetratricopeptide (TPR) repeat protein